MTKKPQSFQERQQQIEWQKRQEFERIQAELAFARGLRELHPKQAPAWNKLIAKAEALLADVDGSTEDVATAVRQAEDLLAPIGKVAKNYLVHLVGHAHIDMNWMWSWPETVAVTNDTFSTVLALMDEFPFFRFSQSQASVYALIEQHHPALLERIKARVKEGRWEVLASHWVEGDKNLANGESLCSHLLYTRNYMEKLFGLKPEDVPIDWSPDTFGHAATVPTYLARGGVRYLYIHRPGVHTKEKPVLFWWEGPDGARVLVRNDMDFGYNGVVNPDMVTKSLFKTAKEAKFNETMLVYGVGDHGGGPTRRDLIRGAQMSEWPIFPALQFSTARTFFENVDKSHVKLPVLKGEINTEFTGCYTTQTLIKKGNRFGENRLQDAELAGTMAWARLQSPYPAAVLEEGWRDILFNQFHDILPGSGVHDTRTYAHGLFQKTMAMTSMVETQALRALAQEIDTRALAGDPAEVPPMFLACGQGAGVGFNAADGRVSGSEQSGGLGNRPLVLFNPGAWDREEIVEATVWDNVPPGLVKPLRERTFSIRTPDGELLPTQQVNQGNYWGHDFVALAFPASVPSLGYRVYAIVEESGKNKATTTTRQTGQIHHCAYAPIERGSEGVENEFVALEIDPVTGGIRSLREKTTGLLLIDQESSSPLEFFLERAHGMSAWSIDHGGPVQAPQVTSIQRKLRGPYKVALEVGLKIRESDFTLTYELRQGDPRVYLHLAGTWFERGTAQGQPHLRIAFPLKLRDPRTRYEIPFGAVERHFTRGEEVPALQWAQVEGKIGTKPAGCLLLNDSKYGHNMEGSILRLTLIRSSVDPDPLPEIGRHEVHLALLPYAGTMTVADATRHARDLNHSIRLIGTGIHKGTLPETGGLLKLKGAGNVILSLVKKAEKEDALLVRLYETAGKAATARLVAGELLTGFSQAWEADLMERPLGAGKLKSTAREIEVKLPPHGIVTVLIKLKKNGSL
ncbi:MAG: glycoside hydrolase family 38 C-terminal domain-containing protein [bacterium]